MVYYNISNKLIFYFNWYPYSRMNINSVTLISSNRLFIIQNKGFIFTTKTIQPKFSKIVPKFGEYFKKTLFSFQGVFNIIKSIVKVAIIFISAYILIKNDLPYLLNLINTSLWKGIVHIAWMTAKLLIISSWHVI